MLLVFVREQNQQVSDGSSRRTERDAVLPNAFNRLFAIAANYTLFIAGGNFAMRYVVKQPSTNKSSKDCIWWWMTRI